ncbi:MAG: hypothetical protein K2M84_00170, partial [Anaeroplasmataceae bacterium]|nr:hypothetical protein [Anaeroplasmataceae bacterium]
SLLRSIIKINKHLMSGILLVMFIVLCSVCFLFIPMTDIFLKIVAVLMLCSFLILFWFIKECYHARKTEE